MSYININDYPRKWIFTHQSMPLSSSDLEQIKPMTQARASQFWQENISRHSPDSDRFSTQDWPGKKSSWINEADWMAVWESDDNALPKAIAEYIDWQDDVTVYFCYEKYNILETKWWLFKKHWKNFLFFDDGPILLGRRRNQALWFASNGTVKLGNKG